MNPVKETGKDHMKDTTTLSPTTQDSLARLRDHVKSPNFVYVVGYSLEKVHSGVMVNLVNGPHGRDLVASFWNTLCSQPIAAMDLEQPIAVREYKTGSRSVVDLLVSFQNNQTGRKHHLLCEYKVEGTQDHKGQCQRFRNNWESSHPDEPTCFAFITTGGARYWTPPPSSCFQHVDLPDLVSLLSPYRSIPLVHDYIEALEDEQLRGNIASAITGLSSDEEPRLGYRGYSWWYAYYHSLRSMLGTPQDWDIYSGTHNPVMCWQPSWKWEVSDSPNKCSIGMFYCEFNYSSLLLKLAWHDGAGTSANVQRLRQAMDECSADLSKYGLKMCLRGSKANQYTTVAKMDIDISQPLGVLVQKVRLFVPHGFWNMASRLVARL